jgi:hypothetical protein
MAYDENKKLFAYTLFMQSLNPEEIAEKIKQTFALKKFAANTVRRWAEDTDKNDLTWEDHRSRVLQIARTRVEKSSADKLSEIQTKTETIAQKLYDMLLTNTELKGSTFDGVAYAFKTMMEFTMKLEDRKAGELSPIMIIQTMFDIFNSIPEVRGVLKKHWPKITRDISARMMPMPAKEISSETIVEEN